MITELGLLSALVYAIIESLEKYGLNSKYAHLLAIPLGILSSGFLLQCTSINEYLMKGLFIGVGAVGICECVSSGVIALKRFFKA